MTNDNNVEQSEFLRLDPYIKDPIARRNIVKQIIEKTPREKLTPRFLDRLTQYIIYDKDDKEEHKKRQILTDNRMVTINKRQTSYEGLVAKFESGEDAIYGMIINDKNVILTPKVSITEKDKEEIPALKSLCDSIAEVEKAMAAATGKKKYLLKKQIIEMRKDQYVIKNAFKPTINSTNLVSSASTVDLSDHTTIDQNGEFHISGCSLCDPIVISFLLCNYSKMKESTYSHFSSDGYYLMMDLQNLIDNTLAEKYPLYLDLIIDKIDGLTNEQIQQHLKEKYDVLHSVEYLSSLWRKKIPKLLAEREKKNFVYWWYTNKIYGKWKKCSRCGQIKPAHNLFFSKNSTSKDGWYSICKECRNKKNKKKG